MKQTLIIILLAFTTITVIAQTNSAQTVVHESKKYKFKVSVPKSWNEYTGIAMPEDTLMTQYEWGIPKTYSASENKDVENLFYITAYNRTSITSIQKLIDVTFASFFNFHECQLETDKTDKNARILLCTKNKYKFKGKYYFVKKKNISYVITFKATVDTYDKNLPIFEKFYESIQFL